MARIAVRSEPVCLLIVVSERWATWPVYGSLKGYCCPKARQDYLRSAQLDGQREAACRHAASLQIRATVERGMRICILPYSVAYPAKADQNPKLYRVGYCWLLRKQVATDPLLSLR